MAATASQISPAVSVRPRVQSVDIVRGFVMILMALDHIRDFFHSGAQTFDPLDLTRTDAAIFLTRWITHFCAPTFVFLAGTGAYLQCLRGRSKAEVSQFLWTRGLWLVFLEVTVVLCFGWKFNFSYDQIYLTVIWALGVSMIALSVLMFLPWRVLLGVSLTMIAIHNAFDGIRPEEFGAAAWLWKILHVESVIQVSKTFLIVAAYPLIPWIFVMAAGFCFGRVMDLPTERRRSLLIRIGMALTAVFVVLRLINVYGNLRPWSVQATPVLTFLSFLDCTKYPPSLAYLLMTIGPVILALGLLERMHLHDSNPLLTFGRVPLFYYLIHLPLIHGSAVLLGWLRYGRLDFLLRSPPALGGSTAGFPADYGYNLAIVYLIWAVIVALLYPVCKWFAELKQRNRSVRLSYL